MSIAQHRFNNALRYRTDDHEMQRQLTPPYVLEPVREALRGIHPDPCEQDSPADRCACGDVIVGTVPGHLPWPYACVATPTGGRDD